MKVLFHRFVGLFLGGAGALLLLAPSPRSAPGTPGGEAGPTGPPAGASPGLASSFTSAGITVAGTTSAGAPWELALRLASWGRGEATLAVAVGAGAASERGWEIRRGPIAEWYRSEARGIEQGFTIAAPPPVAAGAEAPLRLLLAVDGGFACEVLDGACDARFTACAGAVQIFYSSLRAWDAAGRELPAYLAAEEGGLAIVVDDRFATYPLTVDPWIWTPEAALYADDQAWADDRFGTSVSIEGDTALVGAGGEDVAGEDSGAAYVYTRVGTSWTLEAPLLPPDGEAGDGFGMRVQLQGGTALVGAPGDDDGGADSGAVYVFTRDGTLWSLEAKLVASDGAAGDRFGTSLSMDGATALVGAPGDDDRGGDSGSVYAFTRAGSAWSEQAKILADDGEAGDAFGSSVAVDGDSALVGAPLDDTWAVDWGSAYVFVRSGAAWSQEAKGTPAEGSREGWFGWSVALDGDTAVIGAPYEYEPGDSTGAAYVFVRSGTDWSQEARWTGFREFGWSVALEGDTAAVGSPQDVGWLGGDGRVYVFTRSGSDWSPEASLAGDPAGNHFFFGFGISVSLSGDSLLAGAPGDDLGLSMNAGSASVFTRSDTIWNSEAVLARGLEDLTHGDHFAFSAALTGDTALLGAPHVDDLGSDSGAAYVFTRSGSIWTKEAKLIAAGGASGDELGWSVAVDGDTALLGAPGDGELGADAGAAYVFVRSGSTWREEAKLIALDGHAEARLGESVALDGDSALVGAPGDDPWGVDAGSVYFFVRSGSIWTQVDKHSAPAGAPGDLLGSSVSLAGDTALAGAPGDDERGADAGAAYLFVRARAGWSLETKLTAASGAPGDAFGVSVAIGGEIALIGADRAHDPDGNAGAAHAFVRSGPGWTEEAILTAEDDTQRGFGQSVSLDGHTALVGAPDCLGAAAYVFTRAPSRWTQRARLSLPGPACCDHFGHSVALDGATALVGAHGVDVYHLHLEDDSGGAYVFTGTPQAHAISRNAGTNPASHVAATLPVLGTTYTATVDLAGTSGHSFAWLVGFATPLTQTLGGGQVLLVNAGDPSGELLGQSLLPGPVATYDLPVPSDLAYAGFELATQALHLGTVQPFALSNALDLFLGW
ncbi:MAG: hypothetical protein AB1726_12745 [Planctomycetota bacterium]